MSRISSGIATSCSSLTSWPMSSIGKSGERSSGPTGCPVPGCSTGCGGLGMSAAMLYQRRGSSDSASRYFVCSTGPSLALIASPDNDQQTDGGSDREADLPRVAEVEPVQDAPRDEIAPAGQRGSVDEGQQAAV